MEESVKFFMLSVETEDNTFANIYDSYSRFKRDYLKLKEKLPLHTYLLKPVEDDEDLVIAKIGIRWVACMDPKEDIKNTNSMIKVQQQEIKIKE